MKYMVMETHLSYAVVLDEDGRFIKVANLHYQKGQIVTDVMEMETTVHTHHTIPVAKWGALLGAVAVCLFFALSTLTRPTPLLPYASVYLSINPELRIDVDEADLVMQTEGMNEEGKQLLNQMDLTGQPLEQAVDLLVDKAIEQGYLSDGGKITLSLDTEHQQWVVSHQSKLSDHLNTYLQDKVSVTIEVNDQRSDSQQITVPIVPDQPVTEEPVVEEPPQTVPTDNDSGYEPAPETTTPPSNSGYQNTQPTDDGQSNYSDDGQSYYNSDNGQSNYSDDGQSSYDTNDDSQSGYDDQDDD